MGSNDGSNNWYQEGVEHAKDLASKDPKHPFHQVAVVNKNISTSKAPDTQVSDAKAEVVLNADGKTI